MTIFNIKASRKLKFQLMLFKGSNNLILIIYSLTSLILFFCISGLINVGLNWIFLSSVDPMSSVLLLFVSLSTGFFLFSLFFNEYLKLPNRLLVILYWIPDTLNAKICELKKKLDCCLEMEELYLNDKNELEVFLKKTNYKGSNKKL